MRVVSVYVYMSFRGNRGFQCVYVYVCMYIWVKVHVYGC